MNLVQLLIWLVVIGVVLYLVNQVVPMVGWMKTVINVLAALIVFILVLQAILPLAGMHLAR